MNTTAPRCHVCGALSDTEVVGLEIEGVEMTFPHQFVFADRDGAAIGLCNLCFEERHFDDFTAEEIAYFEEQFTKPDANPDA